MAAEKKMGKKSDIENRMAYLDELVKSIGYRSQLISRALKPDSGILSTRKTGFIAGFLTAVVFVLLIPLAVWFMIGTI